MKYVYQLTIYMKLKKKTYTKKQFAIHANHIFCCCNATLSLYKKINKMVTTSIRKIIVYSVPVLIT